MKIIIEGPDKTGKTTLVKAMADTEQVEALFLPAPPFRQMIINKEVIGSASTFLFFADTMRLWQDPPKDFILDRDILSMLAYQGYLLENMNPIILLNLFKSVVYKDNVPDKIIYLVNEPFEKYDADDPFEQFGYERIRDCYEMAVKLVELNFPELEIQRLDNQRITNDLH